MPRNRVKRGYKTRPERRARMFLCSPAAEQAAEMGGGSNPAPPTGYAAQSREARITKTAGAQSEDVPLFTRRRTAKTAESPAPTTNRPCRAIARSAVQTAGRRALRPQAFRAPPQAALGAEIGCSSVRPPPNRRRMGGGDNLTLLLGKQQTPPHRQQAIATPRKVGT